MAFAQPALMQLALVHLAPLRLARILLAPLLLAACAGTTAPLRPPSAGMTDRVNATLTQPHDCARSIAAALESAGVQPASLRQIAVYDLLPPPEGEGPPLGFDAYVIRTDAPNRIVNLDFNCRPSGITDDRGAANAVRFSG